MKQFRLEQSPIVYYVAGTEGEWVLFLHAAFVDHEMFCPQIQYFRKKYRVLAVDIIGHGKSTDTKKGDTVNRMSDWIAAVLEKEKIGKIHLVGVSLGAVLAQDFANRYPDAVSSLACFGGYDINNFDAKMQKENGAAQMRMMLKALISVKWFAKANKKISAYTPEAQNAFYEMNLRFPKRSFPYLASLGSMVNRHRTVPRNYPLLAGCGRHDLPMAQKAVEQWKQREPECRTVIFENAGHCVNMDVPKEFQTVLEEFWTEGIKSRTQKECRKAAPFG